MRDEYAQNLSSNGETNIDRIIPHNRKCSPKFDLHTVEV